MHKVSVVVAVKAVAVKAGQRHPQLQSTNISESFPKGFRVGSAGSQLSGLPLGAD